VPAQHFALKDRGRIAAGQRADLVLVNGDPTTDIKATRALEGVWKAGVRADRASYARTVAAATKAATMSPNALADGIISDFDDGTPAARFGTTWSVTTDAMAGGSSVGEISVVDGGANGSAKSLRITGTINGQLAYAWSGASWSPGAVPMQPGDLSSKKEIVFRTKGDGRTYRVLVFAESKGMQPVQYEFVAPPEWTEITVPWTAMELDGKGVMAIMFLGGPAAGSFAFQVDDVRLR
jgi:hypothetical protein